MAVSVPSIPNDNLVSMYDKMNIGIGIIDANTNSFLYVNQQACDDIRLPREHIVGKHYRDVFWEEFLQFYESLASACVDETPHTSVYHWTSNSMWVQVAAKRIEWQPDEPVIFFTAYNITKLSSSLIEYKQVAYYDSALKLPNRIRLEKDVSVIDDLSKVGAVRFDILHLSSIYDLYGWNVLELLLSEIRDWVLETMAPTAQLYRISENGFCLLRRESNQIELEMRVQQILTRFTQPWVLYLGDEKFQVHCNINIGIIYGYNIASELNSLLFHSLHRHTQDDACYLIFDSEYDNKFSERLKLRQNLMKCIREDMTGFSVNYQPIVEVKTGRWVGVEALCRFELPETGKVPPTKFIEEAEHLSLIDALDDWVYKTAMKQCSDIGLIKKNFRLSLNYSPVRKLDNDFIHQLFSIAADNKYPKRKLGLEVTETAKMKFDDEALACLRNLQAGKVVLSLDDFGMGYSSFENLLRLSANILKTDRTIIENIVTDSNQQYLMKLVVQLARFANMKLVVEGVETEEQRDLLQECGVEFMQGFFFSKPLSAEQLQEGKGNFD